MLRIVTHAFLPFRPEQVWTVLVDFQSYPEWNPLNVSAEGEAVAGTRVPMAFIDPGHPGRIIRQTVRITVADPPRKLEWLGRIPLLFSGRHFFELTRRGDGTGLSHGEIISGLVPALWSKRRVEQQRLAYENFNEALRCRLDQLSLPPGQ